MGRKPETEGSLASRQNFLALQIAFSSASKDLSEDELAEAVTCSVGWNGRRMTG